MTAQTLPGGTDYNPGRRRWIYLGAALAGVGLLAAMLAIFHAAGSSGTANAKAQQLSTTLVAAGLPAPSHTEIVRVLGTDGGAVCTDPAGSLTTGLSKVNLGDGASGPGGRPVITSRDVLLAETLAITVYCPHQLAAFTSYVHGLKYAGSLS